MQCKLTKPINIFRLNVKRGDSGVRQSMAFCVIINTTLLVDNIDLLLIVSLRDLSHRILMLNVMPGTYQYAVLV